MLTFAVISIIVMLIALAALCVVRFFQIAQDNKAEAARKATQAAWLETSHKARKDVWADSLYNF